MGYALFAQQKISLTGQVNSVSLQQTQRSNEQYNIATRSLSLEQKMSSLQVSQATELADLYNDLASADGSDARAKIDAKISEKENEFQAEQDNINKQIYLVSIKENAIEMEVKRLDTRLSALQKQLEAIEDAEGDGIDKATPKFKGVG